MIQLSEKRKQLFWSLWIAAMLYLCRDSMFNRAVIGFYPSYLIQFVVVLAMLFYLVWHYRDNLKSLLSDRRTVLVAALSVAYILPMIAKRDWQFMYFSVLFALVVPILVTFFMDMKSMARCYVVVICVLAVCSLFNAYILRALADREILPVSTFEDESFYNFWMSVVPVRRLKYRNYGIFREPGVYQFFLILAVYLNNDLADWDRTGRVWFVNLLLGLTMFSTLSTAGIIEYAALFIVLFFAQGWYRKPRAVLVAFSIILSLIIAYKIIHWLDGPLWGEIWMIKHKFGRGGQSVTDRVGSFVANALMFLKSPVFGARVRDVLFNEAIDNNTSSSTIMFAIFGLLGGLAHVFSWIVLVWKRKRFFIWNLAFAMVLALSFNSENIIADLFLWLFPMMAVCEKALPTIGMEQSQ